MNTNGHSEKMETILAGSPDYLDSDRLKVITIKSETWFKISGIRSIRPFFMNIVSDSNHWMFISSNGGLTAGRKNNSYSLFPYYTDDKITESSEITGSKTIFQIEDHGEKVIWEPFSERNAESFKLSRNLYKNFYGNKIMFEEINHDLELTFRYQWNSSNLFGFVRKSELINHSSSTLNITLIDGIQNILPYGVEPEVQAQSSNLVDAYKRNEIIKETGLGIYALSAIIVDKAEPSEALKANVVWSTGIDKPDYLLSSLQLQNFRECKNIQPEEDVKGEKGAYFLRKVLDLSAGKTKEWKIVGNVNQNHSQVIELNYKLKSGENMESALDEDIERGSEILKRLVAGADGLRVTADPLKDARHFSNVMFNIMRGGTIDNNYKLEKADLISYLKNASKDLFIRNKKLLNSFSEEFERNKLLELVDNTEDSDLKRICREYLPLKFSRRHGDPSRPWNYFTINTQSEIDGSKILDYEGNWRDIFQNWEALVHSYPGYIDGMIFKFLNTSTFDGYNPYRVTKGGFDWETIEPDNPWSYIGYWGDHQVIYLLKLLEFYQKHEPDAMSSLFNQELFVYANVPYRIKSYTEIAANPKDTILFDAELDLSIRKKIESLGSDGALLHNSSGKIHQVTFVEKLLAIVLSKVSNLIPEGGIWMNTQRPEWNDANNALVGNGVSMVTLYYLRRFLEFFEKILDEADSVHIKISVELLKKFSETLNILKNYHDQLGGRISDNLRKEITDSLGESGSHYRNQIYDNGFSGKKENLSLKIIKEFINTFCDYLDHSIEVNKRADDLFHSYNIMSYSDDGIEISHLSEMLEGQVAILSSGYLSPEESLKLLKSLRNSSLYRDDQNSYILYPNKELPRFLDKNNIPQKTVENSELLKALVDKGNHDIISKDVEGGYHFNGNFRNAGDVNEALEMLSHSDFKELVEKDRELILAIFEEVFNHKAFTGRSGTFFAYEGLGSIYWHMVSKLHLAVSEVCLLAFDKGADEATIESLLNYYYEIGEGLGIHKSPKLYGAFPTDAYSHTPSHRGAQQPGMTGQVKEDILTAINEFGVFVEKGTLKFDPVLLRKSEFLTNERTIDFIHIGDETERKYLKEKEFGFSYCQIPIVYRVLEEEGIEIKFENGNVQKLSGLNLDVELSQEIFTRSGAIKEMVVSINSNRLRS